MEDADKREFVEVMEAVFELHQKPLTKTMLRLYFDALREFPIGAVRDALTFHLKNTDRGQFVPKPADIIRALTGSGEDAALLAWSKVTKAITMVGPWEAVVFDDPLIHFVIDGMGGWLKLCGTPTQKDLEFVGKDFVARYRGVFGRQVQYPKVLCGEFERMNGELGRENKRPPRLIGDPQAARLVYEGGAENGQVFRALPLSALTQKALEHVKQPG